MDNLDTAPLDANELKACTCCGRGVMHAGSPFFYELTMRSCVVDVKNVQRMHGMELMMGGAVGLARALSPSNTVAQRLPAARHLIYTDCAVKATMPLAFLEVNA